MIIILKSGATDEQIDHVIERVESLGLKAHLSRGTYRTIIGVIGDESQFQPEPFQAHSGRGRRDSACCRPTSWPASKPIPSRASSTSAA